MAATAIITTRLTVSIILSDDPHNRSAYCPILRETDKRKAAVSNTAQE
jgi:hypothetical protein